MARYLFAVRILGHLYCSASGEYTCINLAGIGWFPGKVPLFDIAKSQEVGRVT